MRGRVFLFNITQPFAMKIDTPFIAGLAACSRHVTRVRKGLMYWYEVRVIANLEQNQKTTS